MLRFLRRLFDSKPKTIHNTKRSAARRRTSLRVEPLEDRRLLSLTLDASYGVGANPQVVAIADFDGLNGLDLAVTDMSTSGLARSGTLNVLLNDGAGRFSPAPGSPFNFSNTDEFPEGVTAGDFDNNGTMDLAVIFNGGYIRLLSGNGNGTFTVGPQVNVTGSNFVTAADFNQDGKLDLAVTDFGAGAGNDSVSVLMGNGNGTFTLAQTLAGLSNPEQVLAADFDGDGQLDLAVPNQSGGIAVSVFRNTGGAGGGAIPFGATPVNLTSGENGPTGQAVGDFNNDGKPDLAITNVFDNTVSVFLNTSPAAGTISFGAATNIAVGTTPVGVAIGDFDGDGRRDLAVANNGGGGRVSVLPGNGDGTFQSQQNIALGGQPQIMAAGDLNKDGLPDVAVAVPTPTGNNLSVLLTAAAIPPLSSEDIVTGAGQGGQPLVRVFNGNTGALKFGFLAYGANFRGGVRVATGDVNGDGVADIITGPGAGTRARIKVFDGTTGAQLGGPVGSFLAYSSTFTGGVFVAAGDVNGDGHADIITGPGRGTGPRVRVFSGVDGSRLFNFFAYSSSFTGGVFVAAGDVNGDGRADIITGSGAGAAARVRVFDGGNGQRLANFLAHDPSFKGGVFVAAGDVNGDGRADIVTAPAKGGGSEVQVFSGADIELLASLSVDPFTGGLRVATGDITGDGVADIITAAGPGDAPSVQVFDGTNLAGPAISSFLAFDPAFLGGVFVSGARR